MDTTQGFVVPNPTSLEPNPPKKSAMAVKHTRKWLPVVTLLLVAIAVSTGVSLFLFSYQGSRAKVTSQPTPVGDAENPFAVSAQANPFAADDGEVANPFDENTSEANPFDVFSEETGTAGTSGEYQNPF